MMSKKILWITSFRGFNGSKDDKIQRNFIKQFKKKNNIIFCVTQFNEKNVKKNLCTLKNYYYFKNSIRKPYRYCQNNILKNGIDVAIKEKIETVVWSTADIILSKNFDKIINNLKINTFATVFPNIHIYKNKPIDYNYPHFGLDLFVMKLGTNKFKKIIKLNHQCLNYDWGCYEHFLFSISNLIGLNVKNLRGDINVFKFDNYENSIEANFVKMNKSWRENKRRLLKFLEKNKLSKLNIDGSFYYIGFKLLFQSKLSFNFFIINIRLLLKFIKSLLKKSFF